MDLIQNLEWRYATKKMTGEKVSSEKLDIILHATQLTASSYGLQPYTILVIGNADLKKQLLPAAYNQSQIIESSHLLVFCAWADITEKEVGTFIKDTIKKRNMPENALDDYKAMINGTVNGLTVEQKVAWATKQVYIALGTTLIAAAFEQVDATPMEGFDAAQFDEILGLKEKGLRSVVICALGYRSPEDYLINLPKVRRDKDLLFQFL